MAFEDQPRIPTNQIHHKLTSDNNLLWRAQIEPMLRGYGLFHHVDGTKSAPPRTIPATEEEGSPTPNKDFEDWYQEDQKVLSWLTCSVSASVMPVIVGAVTALNAWGRLAKVYGSGSRAQTTRLKQALYALKKGSETVDAYLHRAKGIQDQLFALGTPVAESDVVERVLSGLDESYLPFVRSIVLRPESIALDELHGLLLSEEMILRRTEGTQSESFALSANYVRSGNRGGRGGRGGQRGRGSGRWNNSTSGGGRNGQGQSFYQSGSGGQGQRRSNDGPHYGQPTDQDIQCYNCMGFGHISKNCSSARRAGPSRTTGPQVNYTTSLNGSPWVLDSGTPHHLTSDISHLPVHSEYTGPEEVTFGPGHEENPAPRSE